jgi:hypothetical protein
MCLRADEWNTRQDLNRRSSSFLVVCVGLASIEADPHATRELVQKLHISNQANYTSNLCLLCAEVRRV